MKKARKTIFLAIVISLIIHAIFFAYSTVITIPGVQDQMTRVKRFFDIKSVKMDLPKHKMVKVKDIKKTKTIKFQSPSRDGLSKASFEPAEKVIQKASVDFTEKEPVAPKEVEFKEQIQEKQDFKSLKKKAPDNARNGLVEEVKFSSDPLANPEDALTEESLASAFQEKMPGFTPSMAAHAESQSANSLNKNVDRAYRPAIRRSTNFSDLKEYLISELITYEDPDTKEKYYKISMRVGKDDKELKAAPKEIIFLIDCSKSINEERLEEYKKGLEYSLRNLNEDDVFNILAFKKGVLQFRKESVKSTDETIKQAIGFVDELTLGTKTDAYNALYSSISAELTRDPSYIIFLSDGHPTQGETSPRKIINEISALNNGRRSIFAFSGGSRVNRYLLDFITYKNRGWAEYSYRWHQIDDYMGQFYDKIRDPILLDLRYNASGLNEQELFPKALPDLFRGVEFTLFGTYDQEERFVLRLLGELDGELTEFLVEGNMSDASKGDKSIAENWAFNKMYHLIGQLKHGEDNTAALKQIEELSEKFKIKTPYLEDITQ